MRILFMDTYFPGFFRFLVPYVAEKLGSAEKNEIIFLSEYKRRDYSIPNVRHVSIRYPKASSFYGASDQVTLNTVHQVEAFARAMQKLKEDGFYPDIIIATEVCSAEMINVFPNACRIVYFESYYTSLVDDILISEGKLTPNQKKPMHLRSAFQLSSLVGCHCAIVPSQLQKESFPIPFHDKMPILPMGVDTEFFTFQVNETVAERVQEKMNPELVSLLESPELITWSSRNPSEYAGFSTVCQSIPRILEARPQSRVILVTRNIQLAMENPDCAALLEMAQGRVHLFGQFTWNEYCLLLQKSSAHIYMSAKPHLPISLLEAMCCGSLVIASDTYPLRGIIEHKVNGFLADFFNPTSIADGVINALELNPEEKIQMRQSALDYVVQNYAEKDLVPRHYQRILDCYTTMETYPTDNKTQL